MGQQNSQLIDPDTPPLTLSERSIEAVAKLINDGRVNRIVVLTGAGISTAAGSKFSLRVRFVPPLRFANSNVYISSHPYLSTCLLSV